MTIARIHPARPALTSDQRALVVQHQAFAMTMTRRFERKYRGLLGEDDVKQLVDVALSEAARAFDTSDGTPFPFYAWKRITGAITTAAKDEVRQRSAARRAAEACMHMQEDEVDLEDTEDVLLSRAMSLSARVAMAMVLGLATQAAVEDAEGAESAFGDREHQAVVQRALADAMAALPDRRRELIELYYFQNRELREVAPLLRVGYSTARREHNEALDQLRVNLRARGVGM